MTPRVALLEDAVVVEVKGPDRIAYLHRMVSCDMKALGPGAPVRGLFLTAKGRVVADFLAVDAGDRVLLLSRGPAAGALAEGLSKFLIADDAVVEEVSEAWAVFLVLGDAEIGGPAGDGVVVVPAGACGFGGFTVVAPRDAAPAVQEGLLAAASTEGGGLLDAAALETLRVRLGVPRLGAEFGVDTLPQEAGLEDHVSFTKGCFLGQEPVARLQNRGHTNRGLAGFRIVGDVAPPAGATVMQGEKKVGHLTSVVTAGASGEALAMGLLRHEAAEPGTELLARVGEGAVPLVVASLPFDDD